MAIVSQTDSGEMLEKVPEQARFSRANRREALWGYLFLAPMVIFFLTFSIYPTFGSIRYMLYNWDGIGEPTQFVGFRYVIAVATDTLFWNAFWHTIIYTVCVVTIQLTLALILALVLNNPALRFRNVYRAVFFLPSLTTPAVVAVASGLMIGRISSNFPQWMINAHLVDPTLGILNDPHLAFGAIIVFGIWLTFGYNLVYFLAALQSVPNELYEAARLDGAGRFARFRFITVPMIRSVSVIIIFFGVLGSLGVFDVVWVMTQGGPLFATDVVSTYIYRYAFGNGVGTGPNYGFSASASFFNSLLLLGLSGIYTLVSVRFARQRVQASQER